MSTVTRIYFMLTAADMDRAVEFYRTAFDLEVRSTSPDWSELARGDATLALHGGGSGEESWTGLGFDVPDLEVACRSVVAAGGAVVQPPSDRPGEPIRLAVVRDPEGNAFSLSQPVD